MWYDRTSMKKLLILIACLPVLAFAQGSAPTRTYSLADSSVYTKLKTNLNGSVKLESGLSMPLMSQGNLLVTSNVAYVQNVDNLWNDNAWTTGVTLNYRLGKTWAVYTKTSTNLTGDWAQESGVHTTIWRASNYSVGANAGYVLDYPFRKSQSAKWTAGITVSFPVDKLFK